MREAFGMDTFCGERGVFMGEDEIKRCGCITNGSKRRCSRKEKLPGYKINYPCRYMILRKMEGKIGGEQ